MLGFIPTNSAVKVTTAGSLDGWGLPSAGSSNTYDAFVTYNSENRAITTAAGSNIIYSASVLIFDPVNISQLDTLEWADPLGNMHTGHPLQVAVNADLSGEYTYTKVVI